MAVTEGTRRIVGGVDTHKDLHVAAVVDEQDRVMETRSFATTRQGYRQMLAWMRSFGELQRIGIESTGSYGAGLLRFMQQAKVTVLEVTTPDKQDRRRRGKNDDLDAQNAAHAAFAGQRTVTPRSRDGMIESLRVLMACRKTATSRPSARSASTSGSPRNRRSPGASTRRWRGSDRAISPAPMRARRAARRSASGSAAMC